MPIRRVHPLCHAAITAVALILVTACTPAPTTHVVPNDPLPSWNDGPSKTAIVAFVDRVTATDGPAFVPEAERIAVFDNDGTLWSEQPAYFQLLFAIDRVRDEADAHPEWREVPALAAAIDGDMEAVVAGGHHAIFEVVNASHSGMTADGFAAVVSQWLETARHPRFDRPYDELVFQPMLELLEYLRDNGFSTFIVSGGGIDFMRVFVEQAYGIPPEQVVGSMGELAYEVRDGIPTLVKQPGVFFVNDGPGKPVGIARLIGRRPIAAFGNSDGDFQMIEWTTAGEGPRFGLFVHHDDAEREWAYDRDSSIGRLNRGLDEADERGWTIVSMKDEWKRIYPWESP
jgi:phosphoglycolate phosphatase-like HAD superfamily hydrolase